MAAVDANEQFQPEVEAQTHRSSGGRATGRLRKKGIVAQGAPLQEVRPKSKGTAKALQLLQVPPPAVNISGSDADGSSTDVSPRLVSGASDVMGSPQTFPSPIRSQSLSPPPSGAPLTVPAVRAKRHRSSHCIALPLRCLSIPCTAPALFLSAVKVDTTDKQKVVCPTYGSKDLEL